MNPGLVAAVALAILGFGLVSRSAARGVVSAPMVFVLLGYLLSDRGLGFFAVDVEHGALHFLAEVTLVLVLFTDAARIDLACLRREESLPMRLLGIGLPLTIAAGAWVASWLFDGLSLWECLLLGALLAPTDAALGQAVVTSPEVPVRIRQTLNAESGLNDGLAFPVVLMIACFAAGADATHGAAGLGAADWLWFAVVQIGVGAAGGVAVGFAGARLVEWALARRSVTDSFQRLSGLALALLAFAGAEVLGGNGFVAAFVSGLAFGNTARGSCTALFDFGEAEGQLLTLLVFFAFGAVLLPDALPHIGPAALLYALASLTLVRMLPVAVSLLGTGLKPASVLFLGWFGPRGLASILFVLVVLEDGGVAASESIGSVVTLTVLLSVVLHGVTAHPLAVAYARHVGADEEAGEHRAVPEMPVRIPHGLEVEKA